MNKEEIYHAYEEVQEMVKREFDRNLQVFGDRIHCRRGCSFCCYQLFEITAIEAAYLARWLKMQSEDEQADLEARAKRYREARSRLLEKWGGNRNLVQIEGNLPGEGLRLACPALGYDGACRVYEARPLVCRKYGMPIYHPEHPERLGACELNFQDGETIASDEIIQNQTAIHERWKEIQEQSRHNLPEERGRMTVADAILFDYDEVLDREQGR